MKCDLVIEGGGSRISGLVGALKGIEDKGFIPSHIAGTSAGAIVGACRAAGYTPEELFNILLDTDFTTFLDGNGWGKKVWNITKKKGMYKGDVIYQYINKLLSAKGVYFFKDLLSDDPNDHNTLQYRWKFKCYASDITREKLITWPDDALKYRMRPDYMNVAWAVRCSISIPFFFQPMYQNRSYIVDGGLISNYPIWQWDRKIGPPKHPTFGCLLEDTEDIDNEKERNKINMWPHSYFKALFNTSLFANDRRFIRPGDYKFRTIRIPVDGIKPMNFDISEEEKTYLYNNGITASNEFFKDWSWEEYLKWSTLVKKIQK
jgi:NTE family protein